MAAPPQYRYACPKCPTVYEELPNVCGNCGVAMGTSRRGKLSTRSLVPGQWEGRVIDDRYKVLEIIGIGGMGAVYRVRHERLGKLAAMKVLRHELTTKPHVVKRFRQEASAVSRLTHPHIVQVFDFGLIDDNLYLIMEYVRGKHLESLATDGEPMPLQRLASIGVQTCLAITEAHAHGIIHRDLKPDNILVSTTSNGRDIVKVVDFGLAKLQENEDSDKSGVTEAGLIVGTPYFMAPEQIRGERVTARTDIYSLGATMFRAATGKYPFTAQTPVGVLTAHLNSKLPSLLASGVTGDMRRLEPIIEKAMAKSPDDRYQTAEAMAADLEEMLGTTGAHYMGRASSQSSPSHDALELDQLKRSDLESFENSLRRKRWRGVVFLMSTVVILVVAGFIWLRPPPPAPPLTEEQEPNNRAREANLITLGMSITGFLGDAIGIDQPDADYFKIEDVAGKKLTVAINGVSEARLDVALINAKGKVLTRQQAETPGQPIRLKAKDVPSPLYLVITQVISADGEFVVDHKNTYDLAVTEN